MDRAHTRDAFARLLPPGDERLALLGEATPPLRHGSAGDVPVEGGGELGQRRCGGGGHRDIAREAADRIAREQRIDTEMDHLAFRARRLEAGDPRHIALDDEDRVGIVEIGPRIIAKMAGMVSGQ